VGWFSDMPEGLFEKLQQMRQTNSPPLRILSVFT